MKVLMHLTPPLLYPKFILLETPVVVQSFTSDGGMTHLKEVPRHLRGGSVSVEIIYDLNHRALVGEYTRSFSMQWADRSGKSWTNV